MSSASVASAAFGTGPLTGAGVTATGGAGMATAGDGLVGVVWGGVRAQANSTAQVRMQIADSGLRAAAGGLPAALRPVALDAAARVAPRLRGGRVYTDDVAPVEWLIDASIVKVAADGEGG